METAEAVAERMDGRGRDSAVGRAVLDVGRLWRQARAMSADSSLATRRASPTFYEFFAGGGMARLGLGEDWRCLFANDLDPRKGRAYAANFGAGELKVGDIRQVVPADLPGAADLVWGSFPCQDLSLAGVGRGLRGERSGTFYAFWDVIAALAGEGRAPRLVAIENVCGTLTSHGGQDFQAICRTFAEAGYRYGALVIDAELFVPQSRPRLFVVGVREDVEIDPVLVSPTPLAPFHTQRLRQAADALPQPVRDRLVWWRLAPPPRRTTTFADLVETEPTGVAWRSAEETCRLLALMSPVNLAKVEAARQAGGRRIGGVYRRTRRDADGTSRQRAEARFDEVSGCLRTPAGGSSRQTLLVVEDGEVRSRLISPRETARLMGLPDSYRLPASYNEAYHLTGDGVVAPVVRRLAAHLLEPLLGLTAAAPRREAA